jgi:hypothetical protein
MYREQGEEQWGRHHRGGMSSRGGRKPNTGRNNSLKGPSRAVRETERASPVRETVREGEMRQQHPGQGKGKKQQCTGAGAGAA